MGISISDSDSNFNMSGVEDERDVEYRLVTRAVFADGRSETDELKFSDCPDVDNVADEIREILWNFHIADDRARIAQLTPDQRSTYEHWLDDATECRCDGVCGGLPCIHDTHEQAEWLEHHTKGGVIVEWQWLANGTQIGHTGSAEFRSEDFEKYDETGEQLHMRIARELGAFMEELDFELRDR